MRSSRDPTRLAGRRFRRRPPARRHAPASRRGRIRRALAHRQGLTVGATALVVSGLVASLLTVPPADDLAPDDIEQLVAQQATRWRTDLFSSRPAYLPEPSEELSTASPPAPLVDTTIVSKTVLWDDRPVPYVVPDSALPLRYVVGADLAERFGIDVVVEAMSQWDGIPGSRWATEFVGVSADVRPRRPSGTSLVHLRESCPEHFLGGAYWNVVPGAATYEARYGVSAVYGHQIDVGVCNRVTSPESLRAVLAHELGHMMGMGHLCEPGEVCWSPQLDSEDRRCRVMYYLFGPCRGEVDGPDRDAARHLYPTLQRLYGPSPEDTSARASYATTWTHTAERVVLASTVSAYPAATAVALAGVLDAPLLLAEPDDRRCVVGPAAEELARAAANPATVVLVGDWPEACEEVLAPWDLTVERVGGAVSEDAPVEGTAARASVLAADAIAAERTRRGSAPDSALLAVADGTHDGALDAAVAGAVAGARGVPLLLSESDGLSGAVASWLARHPTVRRVQVLGERVDARLLDELVELGLLAVRVPGADPAERALRLAELERPFAAGGGDEPVVIAGVADVIETLAGGGVAARLGAPLLLTGADGDAGLTRWLRRRTPTGGWLVAAPESVPHPLQWELTRHVLAPDTPVPSREDAPRPVWPFAARLGN